MKWYVYVLLRSDWKYYIWSTRSIQNRFIKHKNWWVQSTKWFRPLLLIWFREFETYKKAQCIEKELKKSKSKTIVQDFIGSCHGG